jgi:Zn-dependent peptidase ImmA (M78 family)
MLQDLRALQPKRQLTWTEAKATSARQANRLAAKYQDKELWAFDVFVIGDQPRIQVSLDDHIRIAGSSHWTGSHWQIVLNANDQPVRRRFTLAHEYKHIIDHGRPVHPDIEERVCDHFAACLLMPKTKVVAAWTGDEIDQTVEAMATAFGVSKSAMTCRLSELGLQQRPRRQRGETQTSSSTETRQDGPAAVYYGQTCIRSARTDPKERS